MQHPILLQFEDLALAFRLKKFGDATKILLQCLDVRSLREFTKRQQYLHSL